jgi:hypothetical protein
VKSPIHIRLPYLEVRKTLFLRTHQKSLDDFIKFLFMHNRSTRGNRGLAYIEGLVLTRVVPAGAESWKKFPHKV